jgi:phage-related minor tail protein
MATNVGRSLSEIDNKVRQLSQSIKESSKKTKELDRTLKLDPRSTQVAAQQMRALSTQIGQATQNAADCS